MEPAIKGNDRPEQNKVMNILVADDDRFVVEYLSMMIRDLGHKLHVVGNGQQVLAFLDRNPDMDVVIVDWAMPVMDGLETVKRMKSTPGLRNIPIIMITGSDKVAGIERGLEAGVFYYLTKPVKKTVLQSVIASAGRAAQQNKILASELGRHRASFDLIDSCRFKFRTLAEAENLAVFMAGCFPDAERVLSGLGELLVNAVEHGNLGIGLDGKRPLIESGTWRTEVERLQALPENAGKYAVAAISRKEDGIYVVIEDQGRGFDWKKFMTVDPARAGDHHGRGIAQARAASFDKLTYNDKGNKAVAFVKYVSPLEW